IPGAYPADDFKAKLVSWYKDTQNAALGDFSYAPEAYDATTLSALAALKAKSTVSADIQAQLAAVSGASGKGTKCKSYAECAPLVTAGTDIQYV
ncbi:hypothetical protein, partial [Mucilaginibacter sp. 5C4]